MKKLSLFLLALLLFTSCSAPASTPQDWQKEADEVTWQPDMVIENVNIFGLDAGGFNAMFTTQQKYNYLIVMWTVYPSDIFMTQIVRTTDGRYHSFSITTFPEGGTIMWRIENGKEAWFSNHGTDWFYQNLPRPETPSVLPPPYLNNKHY